MILFQKCKQSTIALKLSFIHLRFQVLTLKIVNMHYLMQSNNLILTQHITMASLMTSSRQNTVFRTLIKLSTEVETVVLPNSCRGM